MQIGEMRDSPCCASVSFRVSVFDSNFYVVLQSTKLQLQFAAQTARLRHYSWNNAFLSVRAVSR